MKKQEQKDGDVVLFLFFSFSPVVFLSDRQ